MRTNSWFLRAAVAAVVFVAVSIAAPTARALTITAFVVRQHCANGDVVQVTLSARTQPTQRARYRWDFNNDGVFDTALSTDPTVTRRYPDERNITARVVVINNNNVRATDSVTFRTARCD